MFALNLIKHHAYFLWKSSFVIDYLKSIKTKILQLVCSTMGITSRTPSLMQQSLAENDTTVVSIL
jgi:hypothetical protein